MEQDKIAEACAKFAESYHLDRALGTLLNLAVCHEKEGKTATAWSEFSDAAAEATTEKDERLAFAQKRAAALAPELPRAQLAIAPAASSLASLDIQVDKAHLGRGAWSSAIPLDPGEHEITAAADGKKTYHATFTIPKGPTVTSVNVPALENAPHEAPPKGAPTSPETPAEGGGGAQRSLGYVASALGIVGIGVGTAFGFRAMSLKDDRDGQCDPSHACSPSGVDSDKDARSAATLSTASFIAGGALLVGGVVLVLTAPSSRSVKVGTTGRGLFVGGTF